MRPTAYLQKAQRSLSFAAEQSSELQSDSERWPWVSIALIMALQASLVAALSGYETASPADILDPSDPSGEKQAPLSLMLRRVRSAECLNQPERLDLPVSASKGAEKLLAYRNAVIHGPVADTPLQIAAYAHHTLNIITHLLIDHPTFDPSHYKIEMTHICDHIRHIRRQIDAVS